MKSSPSESEIAAATAAAKEAQSDATLKNDSRKRAKAALKEAEASLEKAREESKISDEHARVTAKRLSKLLAKANGKKSKGKSMPVAEAATIPDSNPTV